MRHPARRPASRPKPPPGPTLPGRLLAIDIGSRLFGWATADLDATGKILARASGCVDLESLGGPGRWQRVDLFARWLTLQLDRGASWVAVEEPQTGRDNLGTRHLLHGLFVFGQVISWRRFGQPARSISRMDVFEATVGWRMRQHERQPLGRKGRPLMRCPSKREILAAINARHGWQLESEDEADAVAMLDLVLAEIHGSGMTLAAKALPEPKPAPLLAGLEAPAMAIKAPEIKTREPLRRIVPGGLPLQGTRPVRGRRKPPP